MGIASSVRRQSSVWDRWQKNACPAPPPRKESFAILEAGDLHLTWKDRAFTQASVDGRRMLFAEALRAHVPLAGTIRQMLDERWNHRASAVRFRDELEDHMSPNYAADTLRAVIGWGRYAALFSYDEEAEQFNLEDLA